MSDLMRQLKWAADRDDDLPCMIELDRNEAKLLLAHIKQIERELDESRQFILEAGITLGRTEAELSEEKALADRLYTSKRSTIDEWCEADSAYRKARGL